MSNNKRKINSKGLISLSLYTLMLKTDYEDISVKEICEKAGVSRMSFYRYYTKKDDIFIQYCDERFEEFYNNISKIKNLDLNIFTLEMFRFINKYSRQIKVLKKAHREFLLLDQLNHYAKYVISHLEHNYLKEKKNNPLFPYFMSGGLFNVIVYWIMDDNLKLSPEAANELLYQIADSEPTRQLNN